MDLVHQLCDAGANVDLDPGDGSGIWIVRVDIPADATSPPPRPPSGKVPLLVVHLRSTSAGDEECESHRYWRVYRGSGDPAELATLVAWIRSLALPSRAFASLDLQSATLLERGGCHGACVE